MRKPRLAKSQLDPAIADLAAQVDHSTLAIWASDCAERALPYFERRRPDDDRPRRAIAAARAWARTGVFRMADVRGASLAAHRAAHEVEADDAARSAAHAAGQAVATAHVPRHALAAAIYAATTMRDAADPTDATAALTREREWQYHHLAELREQSEQSEQSEQIR